MQKLPPSLLQSTIGFIGAGNMASAIISGLISSGFPQQQIHISNPSQAKLHRLQDLYPNIMTTNDNAKVAESCHYLLLSVKPQKIHQACTSFSHLNLSDSCIISVAAGITTSMLEQLVSSHSIIRSMPNTPASIGLGATGLYSSSPLCIQQKSDVEAIFNAIGTSVWVSQEEHMDLVTAISGSGPAHYFFYLEAVCQAAIKLGMSEDTARLLASQTALGAASMVQHFNELPISQLRQQVTSPGGTTAAALDVLQLEQLQHTVEKAINASVKRGHELARLTEAEILANNPHQ